MSYLNLDKKISVLISAVKIKLDRGEDLETILSSYVDLSSVEKNIIRNFFEK